MLQGFTDDNYMVQYTPGAPGSTYAETWVRYTDANNGYRVRFYVDKFGQYIVALHDVENGQYTSLGSANVTAAMSFATKVKLNGTSIKVWVDGTLRINVTNGTHAAGGVAFSGQAANFDDIKVGYDVNTDDDIDDAGDQLVLNETFSGTSTTFVHDDAGNLVDDGTFVYVYDAWNRLVKAMSSVETDVVIHVAEFDGTGRRVSKVVTNAGDLDGTEVYYYSNRWQVIEVRDGSANLLQQIYHGTQYIDEVVAERLDKGVAFVHQDANWNVIALTDFAGQILERYDYTPYGTATIDQETMFGDSDGDSFVTEAEWDTDISGQLDSGDTCWGSSPSGACRLVDFDFDGDVDSADATVLAGLDSGETYRAAYLASSNLGNTRAHLSLIVGAETKSYQNRNREYLPALVRSAQRLEAHPNAILMGGTHVAMNLYSSLGDSQSEVAYDYALANAATSLTKPDECSACLCAECLLLPDCECCVCLKCNGLIGIFFTVSCP